MADVTGIEASQSVKIAGALNTGVEDNYADVDSNNNLKVISTNAGPVVPGTAAVNSGLIGGQFNTALPTLTTGQQSAIQVDSSGRIIVRNSELPATVNTNYGTVGASTLRTAAQIGNATGAADFNNGATGAQTLRVASNAYDGSGTAITSTTIGAKQSLDVTAQGNIASGSADSGNPVKVGMVFNTTPPTPTSGNRVDLQSNM